MKKICFLLCFVLCQLFFNSVYSQTVRSNHSYKNLGFTQLPTVSIGGYIDMNVASPTQEKLYSDKMLNNVLNFADSGTGILTDPALIEQTNLKNRATEDVVFAGEASLLFKVNGVNDYGFLYGVIIELNANSTYNSWNNDLNSTKSFIYGETIIGKIEFGNELGVSQKMKIDAGTIARGAGGINGKYLNFINLPSIMLDTTAISTPLFILIPQLPTAHGGFAAGFNNLFYRCDANGNGTLENNEMACYSDNSGFNYRLAFEEMQNATKVSYYTPEILGFQAGVSYTPDTGNKGVSGYLTSKLDTGDIDEVLEYGISYSKTFYGLAISASFTGEIGKTESMILDAEGIYSPFREDLKAYQYGLTLSFYGLSLAGSMGNWDRSLYYIELDKDKGIASYKTYGVGYEFEGFNVSVTYFDSEFQNNTYKAYSVGVDYKVAKGFSPYVEYTGFEFDFTADNIAKNKGSVVLVGFLLNF